MHASLLADSNHETGATRQNRIRWEAAVEDAQIQYAEAYRFRHFEA
ncbi:hypothetical protein GA0115253_1014129 [Streptomyces sp. Termitarium-T10T-6]|nr:hypothetical protein GA0115253_1014129 [Streptomyces sp. Termitarium-T10T-6]